MARAKWRALFAVVLLPLAACSEESDLPFAPIDCARSRPDDGYLNAEVTIDAQNPTVIVSVFRGDIELDRLVRQDTVSLRTFSYELPVDQTYAVTARYLVGADTVLVIDADDISVTSEEFQDADCYTLENGNVDLRLRLK
jgi:hypothetical protein